MLPSLFIAHGSPFLALEDTPYTQFLHELGRSLPKPKAIILFSAHWESAVQMVGNVKGEYDTIYDFGGFPKELYQIKYPAKGHEGVAEEVKECFVKNGITFEVDGQRGLDHGAWVILRMLYPNADVPVISMSVNQHLSPRKQYEIGKALSSLREEDVLVIGSGGTVHNLRALGRDRDEEDNDQWAVDFDQWLEDNLNAWDTASLFDYYSLAPNAQLAVPPYGKEHFVPLFYAMGAADDQQKASLLHRSYRYGNLSHSVWRFGV